MARSLKERYQTQRIQMVLERAKTADVQLLKEARFANLLVEAMNDDDLKKVTAIVQKLSSIKNPQMPKLTAAIEQAEAEINKYTVGGPLTAAWTRMKKLVGIDNPVVKVTTFADALERGFSQIPNILKNNGVDLQNVDLKKSLLTLLSTPGPTSGDKKIGSDRGELGGKRADSNVLGSTGTTQNEAGPVKGAAEGKIKSIVAQLQKALSPGGIFGAFKKVPYINSAELAQELIKVPLNVFSQVAKKIRSGSKAAEVATDLKSQVTGTGGVETKGTEQEIPTKQTSQTQPPAPTKDPTTATSSTPTGEETPKPQGGGAQQNYAKAKEKVVALLSTLKKNPKGIDAVVKRLVDAGLDVDKI